MEGKKVYNSKVLRVRPDDNHKFHTKAIPTDVET